MKLVWRNFSEVGNLNLRAHALTHIGEKCQTCLMKFAHAGNLRTHLLTHTGGNLWHVKLVWRNSPELVINLRTHLLIHNGEQSSTCKTCLKKFNHTFSLKTHLVTHTGDKPFECEACLKKFSQAAHLRRHQMTHLGEKLLDNKPTKGWAKKIFTCYLVGFFGQLPTSLKW